MDAISPKSSNFVCGTGNYSILLCRRFFMRNCIINYEGRYYDTVCSDDVYDSNAEIKEGKGASMTLTLPAARSSSLKPIRASLTARNGRRPSVAPLARP